MSCLALGSEPPITTGGVKKKTTLKVPEFLKTREGSSLGSKGAQCLAAKALSHIHTRRSQAAGDARRDISSLPAGEAHLPKAGRK